MILTKEFLQATDACTEGYRAVLDLNLLGQNYDVAASALAQNNYSDYAEWLNEQKTTEAYVRANGTEIKMGSYKVFNPITATYIDCVDESSVRNAMVEISKQILANYSIGIVQTITNENGDQAWISATISQTVNVS